MTKPSITRGLLTGAYSHAWPSMLLTLSAALEGAPDSTLDFFDTIFFAQPPIHTVRQFADRSPIGYGATLSRFERAALPSPKTYLLRANLVRVAFLFGDPRRSLATVAGEMRYSSPQCLSRIIRDRMHMNTADFRAKHTGASLFDAFVSELIVPYQDTLRHRNVTGRSRYTARAA